MTILLQTKLTIPAVRPTLVARDRLLRRLDNVLNSKLLLVSAPAGFGKTTLLAAYGVQAAAVGDTAVSWLSLGEEDNDPARFLAYFLAALEAASVKLGETAVPSTAPDLMMTDVVNSITAVIHAAPHRHLLLILDDYHLIHNQAIHKAITFLLEHMPAAMHLLLATRADPPLPLARWRARGQLAELRQQELRFTPEETADFLNRVMTLSLPTADVQILNRRTEGWIAGLQMAAVSLQGRPDAAEFVQSFGGSHRYILDYLMEEVLSRQPEAVTRFLLQTAVLDRMCAPLCDAILEAGEWRLRLSAHDEITTPHSQLILEKLETANLFIIPLDQERRWYRYHRLFSDLLRQRLALTYPALIPALHRRAAVWFEANGCPDEAIGQALQGGAFAQAAALIEQTAETMLMRSELATVLRWLAALPEIERAKRPLLSLYYAWALIMEGRAQTEVERALRQVDIGGAPGELALVRALLALLRGDGTTAVTLSTQAQAQLPTGRPFLHSAATWIRGLALLFRGDLEAGVQALEQAVQLGQQMGNMTIAATSLARLANQAWRNGDLRRARQIYEQALVLATDEAERPLPIAGELHLGLARIYFEWNDLEAARQHAETGLALSGRWREVSTTAAYIWLARVRQVLGDGEAAHSALAQARKIARQSEGTRFDDMAVDMAEASMRLLEGNTEAAAAFCAAWKTPQQVDVNALQQRDDMVEGHLRKYEFLILARLRLAQQRPHDALALLHPLLTDSERLQRCDLQIENHVLTALAYEQLADKAQADYHAQAALGLGEQGGFVRLFVEAGPAITDLLRRQKAEGGRQKDYLHRLLAACGQPAAPPISNFQPPAALIEPLSERELEVLALIAGGLSNREIAQRLVLSLPTIKWHTSNIYGKLGVGNRITAVARAREMHLLP
ncbi:MAG: LuxR C-terminal-related transcriptional regulator [Chloroflexota bacterium]